MADVIRKWGFFFSLSRGTLRLNSSWIVLEDVWSCLVRLANGSHAHMTLSIGRTGTVLLQQVNRLRHEHALMQELQWSIDCALHVESHSMLTSRAKHDPSDPEPSDTWRDSQRGSHADSLQKLLLHCIGFTLEPVWHIIKPAGPPRRAASSFWKELWVDKNPSLKMTRPGTCHWKASFSSALNPKRRLTWLRSVK